ncbi:Beta-glucuronidase [Folsomia candida]|uniref:Beta-glucuronidase n=1 Tax=Folsomia candida TaxID=158441 RepID=A0A226E1P7_FOLCA|nr:Beta-glucuronidase [Folsomia candida]
MDKLFLVVVLVVGVAQVHGQGILFPRDSESRESKSLDGIWNFRQEPKGAVDLGLTEGWFNAPLEQSGEVENMPVPSSYQDLSNDRERRDYFGWVWYDREFWVSPQWTLADKRVFLRFGSVNYYAIVWVNGVRVTEHQGGHLPFQAELSLILNSNTANRITVAVNNTLTSSTVPQGFVRVKEGEQYPANHTIMSDNFDFFKYAGIHRSVLLYTTPRSYIDDITATPSVTGTTGTLTYNIATIVEGAGAETINVDLLDKEGTLVSSALTAIGTLVVPNAKLWWPYTMVREQNEAGYLYTLRVTD